MSNKSFKICGVVNSIMPYRRYGANNDKYRQDFIFDAGTEDKPNLIRVTMRNWLLCNKHEDVSRVCVGNVVTCSITINGKESKDGKVFNELVVLGVEDGDTTERENKRPSVSNGTPVFAGGESVVDNDSSIF